ncbi:MAG: Ig-like domain-containing protein [Muribaculaceae bacterium]|nr:Ig-like domain-containing protein [Muribaculaceae bacterium]
MENANVTVPEGSEDAYNSSPVWDPMVEGEVQKAEVIELNHTEIELLPKESITLVAVVLPEDAIDRSVTWSSSDYYVAKVDENGVVRAAAVGSAVITATASNGVNATCLVTVKDDSGDVSSINLDSFPIMDIYNLEGILLRANADLEYWKTLPKGIYILHIGNRIYKMRR